MYWDLGSFGIIWDHVSFGATRRALLLLLPHALAHTLKPRVISGLLRKETARSVCGSFGSFLKNFGLVPAVPKNSHAQINTMYSVVNCVVFFSSLFGCQTMAGVPDVSFFGLCGGFASAPKAQPTLGSITLVSLVCLSSSATRLHRVWPMLVYLLQLDACSGVPVVFRKS